MNSIKRSGILAILRLILPDKKLNNSVARLVGFIFVFLFCTPAAFSDQSTPKDSIAIAIEGIDISLLKTYPELDIDTDSLDQYLKEERSKYPKLISLEQLELIADSFTKYYRSKGFKFHSVFIPPQKVGATSVVRFDMLEATLGDVHVRGPDKSLNRNIEELFTGLVGKTLSQPAIDQIVFGIKQQYGLETFSYYSRGNNQGEVRLNIKAEQTKSWRVSISGDNFGQESTGKDRVTLATSVYDSVVDFDSLSFGVQQVSDGEKNTFGYLSYSAPLWSLDHVLSVDVSNNVFGVGQEFSNLGIEGDAKFGSVHYLYTPIRTFEKTHNLALSLDYKSNDYENRFNDPFLTQDEVSKSASLSWFYVYRPIASGLLYRSFLDVTQGEFELELTEDNSFTKYRTIQQLEWSLGDAAGRAYSSLRWAVKGQYSSYKLSSFEQMSITGAYGVRDYTTGYFSSDRGVVANIEWWWPNLLSWSSQNIRFIPFLYIDMAYAERLDMGDDYDSSVELAGGGIGLQGLFYDKGMITISAGNPFYEETKDNPKPEKQSFLIRFEFMLP